MDVATTGPPMAMEVAPAQEPFEFRGDWREYFRIWIVNLALTLLTLGVFSAWASVRTRRWFYGNTWVAGAPFEYLAEPVQILKGRLVAVGLLVVYVLTEQLVPFLAPFLLLALSLAAPWLVATALRFRARYSAWRSLNFRFEGTDKDARRCYFLLYLGLLPTLGAIYPYVRHQQQRYTVDGHRFGGEAFTFHATVGQYYRIFGVAVLVVVAALAMAVGAFVGVTALAGDSEVLDTFGEGTWVIATFVILYLAFLPAWVYVRCRLTNLTYDRTTLGPHGFRATLRFRDLLGLYLTNTAAVVLSLGLLMPWADVRMARYRAAHLALVAGADTQSFVGAGGMAHGATGGEAAEAFDMDISL